MSDEGRSPTVKKKRQRLKTTVGHSILGVKEDFEALIQKFVASETVRYENFAEIWRELKMSFIHFGRQNHQETREFLEDIFMLALSYYLSPYSFQVRTGGLYLMYGLFNTQYCVPPVKFRVTLEIWKDILDYQKEAHSQQHYDIDFVFQSMKAVNGFSFVSSKKEVFLKNNSSNNQTNYFSPVVEEVNQSNLDSALSSDDVRQLTAVDYQYQQLKIALAGPNAKKPDISLAVIQDNIVQSVTSTLQQHQERLNKLKKKSGAEEPVGEDENQSDPDYEPEKHCETTGSRRARIKAKAFSSGNDSGRRKKRKSLNKESEQPSSNTETDISGLAPIEVMVESEGSDVCDILSDSEKTPDEYISVPDLGISNTVSQKQNITSSRDKITSPSKKKKSKPCSNRKKKSKPCSNRKTKSKTKSPTTTDVYSSPIQQKSRK